LPRGIGRRIVLARKFADKGATDDHIQLLLQAADQLIAVISEEMLGMRIEDAAARLGKGVMIGLRTKCPGEGGIGDCTSLESGKVDANALLFHFTPEGDRHAIKVDLQKNLRERSGEGIARNTCGQLVIFRPAPAHLPGVGGQLVEDGITLRGLELVLDILDKVSPDLQSGVRPILTRLKAEELQVLPSFRNRFRPVQGDVTGQRRKNARSREHKDDQASQCDGSKQKPVIPFFISVHGFEKDPWFREQ